MKEIKPNLFILDYRLHDMNGVELYDLLHDMKGLEDIPAIIMSASLDSAPVFIDTVEECSDEKH